MLGRTNCLGDAPDPPDPPDPADPVSSNAAQDPPTTLAGGQDDGSYTKLAQISALGVGVSCWFIHAAYRLLWFIHVCYRR